jgi:predicted RNase H-like HicB family nuclease
MQNYKFPIIVEEDADGFFANCPSLQGCYTSGKTYEEAVRNLEDAIRLHLEDREEDTDDFSQSQKISFTTLELAI